MNPPGSAFEVRKGIVICRRHSIHRKDSRKRRNEAEECQRSQTITPMTIATTSNAPRMYLLAANQDSEAEPNSKLEQSERSRARPLGYSAEHFAANPQLRERQSRLRRRLVPLSDPKFEPKKNPSKQKSPAHHPLHGWLLRGRRPRRAAEGAGRATVSLRIPRRTCAPAIRESRRPCTSANFSTPAAQESTERCHWTVRRWLQPAWQRTRKTDSSGPARALPFPPPSFPVPSFSVLGAEYLSSAFPGDSTGATITSPDG
jgi:hypothetical protein